MSTVHNEIMAWNFSHIGKRFLFLAIGIVLVCGAMNVWLFWPQISETMAFLPQMHGDQLEHALEMSMAGISGGTISAASLGARTALVVSGLFGVLLGCAYWLLVAAWLYQQAERVEMSGILWFVLALVGNLAAVLAFNIARGVLRVQCGSCGGWTRKGSTYCSRCGCSLSHSCPSCGAALRQEDDFCSRCGEKIE